ncbi:MAG: prepilin-type N-terminal cleavage/methylation domain-containing protein [Phycisphaerales bacterium]
MRNRANNLRRAFTIVEMLVVVAIIVVLLSILLVAVSLARGAAQRASTSFTMSSIAKGLAQFKTDLGYLPPVLGPRTPFPQSNIVVGSERDAVSPPDPTSGQYGQELQNWFSETTLAEYLLGAGDRTQDGYGLVGNYQQALSQFGGSPGVKELPPLGIRSPGADGVWGAWTNPRSGFPAGGQLVSRNLTGYTPSPPLPQPALQANNDSINGKVYGPYLDLKESRVVGRLATNGDVAFPGDAAYDESRPAVITDYWGRPIRYYRRLHVPRDPKTPDLRGNLGDVFVLRPWTLKGGAEADGLADATGDTTTSRPLQTAAFALFSPGNDRSFDLTRRVDADKTLNKDNITEAGQ